MFRRLHDTGHVPAQSYRFQFDGRDVEGFAGESVAAALLRAGVTSFRLHPIDASPRLPYCMMGVCQECLVCVEDGPARRACLLPVAEGLRVGPATGKDAEP